MKERDVVLLALGGAVLVWLIFREGGSAGASQQAALSLPTVQVPGVQTYSLNIPPSRNLDLASYQPPVVNRPWRSTGLRSTSNPSSSLPTCGCQNGSGGSSGTLFTSVGQMLSTWLNNVEGLEENYASNILSAVQQAGGRL